MSRVVLLVGLLITTGFVVFLISDRGDSDPVVGEGSGVSDLPEQRERTDTGPEAQAQPNDPTAPSETQQRATSAKPSAVCGEPARRTGRPGGCPGTGA